MDPMDRYFGFGSRWALDQILRFVFQFGDFQFWAFQDLFSKLGMGEKERLANPKKGQANQKNEYSGHVNGLEPTCKSRFDTLQYIGSQNPD